MSGRLAMVAQSPEWRWSHLGQTFLWPPLHCPALPCDMCHWDTGRFLLGWGVRQGCGGERERSRSCLCPWGKLESPLHCVTPRQ